MAITSILIVAIGSSIVIASHAIPDGQDTTAAAMRASKAVDRMIDDLQYAVAINLNSATAIEFMVNDRSGDAVAETIRYEWSGNAGDPLTRQYNGGSLINVMDQVDSLDLSYLTKTYSRQLPPVVSGEMELSSHTTAATLKEDAVDNTKWRGQYFEQPNLVADAESWSVTRVLFMGRYAGASNGYTDVQLRAADGSHLPADQIHDFASVFETNLPVSASWYEVTFPNARGFPMDRGLCLVFEWKSDAQSIKVQFDDAGGSNYLTTTDAGVSWANSSSKSLLHTIYGTYTSPGAMVDAYALTRVDIQLICSADRDFVLYGSASMHNLPDVSAP